jgi:hypothetical protein
MTTLKGTLIALADGPHKYGFRVEDSRGMEKPEKIIHIWPAFFTGCTGMGWRPEENAIGKEAELRNSTVSVYLESGIYWNGRLASEMSLEPTVEPIPYPKVRKGVETRWHKWNGRWEKYLKAQGWVPA